MISGKKQASKFTVLEAQRQRIVWRSNASIEFLRALCGLSFANFAVKGSCSSRKSKDFNREGREERAAKHAKKFKLRHDLGCPRHMVRLEIFGFQQQAGYVVVLGGGADDEIDFGHQAFEHFRGGTRFTDFDRA